MFREFLADCLFSSQNRKPYELPWEQKTIWSLVFGAMLLVAISGNVIVLWIVLGKFRLQFKRRDYHKLCGFIAWLV